MLCSVFAVPGTAFAQTYSTTSTNAIGDANTCGSSVFTRTINVPDSFTITDLDVGFLASHTWRGDIQLDLSHGGTTVRLITTNTSSGNQQNYNVRLDDEAATLINTSPHNTNDGLTAPPYENTVRPSNALSAFDGQNANGTWTFSICDDYAGADDGTFLRADLFFSSAAVPIADLSLDISTPTLTVNEDSTFTITAEITNNGPDDATGVAGQMTLPLGLTYVSSTGGATHSGGGVTWSVPGTLISGSSSIITIDVINNTSMSQTVYGQITSSDQDDSDSTAGNNSTTEDDDDQITITPPAPPSPPSLSCPMATILHDFDSYTWTAGTLSNSYTTSGESLDIAITGDTGFLQINPVSGNQTPELTTLTGGGLSPVENNLLLFTNYGTQSNEILTTMDFNASGAGVGGLSFTIFDADFGENQFEDRIVVTGSLNGISINPILTESRANDVSGNTVLGDYPAVNNTDNGNIYVLFDQPVDQVQIVYGSGTNTPVNPGQQAIGLHDITVCPRGTAALIGNKSIEIYDPDGLGLYAVPGNDVIYTITLSNTGTGSTDPDSVMLIDVMPPEIEFYNGDIDDGGPETDPVSFSQIGTSGLTFNYGTDVGYSNSATKPANFAACTYSPSSGYDPNVTFICFNPKGVFAAGTPDPEISFSFRARIE